MRKVVAGVSLLLMVLAVGFAVAVANLDSYLNDNKAWIEEQVEAALARPVSFDEVGLAFVGGLGVRIANFRIGEDPDYGEGDFFSVDEASVRVAIWPALFGRMEVTRIAFDGVSLVVVSDVSGMNVDTLGGVPSDRNGAPHGGDAAKEVAASPSAPPRAPATSAIDAFSVGIAEIRGGNLRYIDRTADPVAQVDIARLAFRAQDIGRLRPLVFRLTGELLGDDDARSNLEIEGRFGPLPDVADRPIPLDVRFEIDPIRMAGLRELPGIRDSMDPSLPIAGTMRLSGRASGDLERPSIEFDLDATDALVAWAEDGKKERGVPFAVAFDVGMADNDLAVRSVDLQMGGVLAHVEGQVTNLDDPVVDLTMQIFDGQIDLDGGWNRAGQLTLDANLARVDLAAITRAFASEGARLIDGRLNLSLALSGEGATVEELLEVVAGTGHVSIDGGVLHDVNLVEEALAGFTGVPGLSSQLPAKLQKKYPQLFETGNTEFGRLEASVEVRDGRLHVDGIDIDVADFALRGDGTVSLAGKLELTTMLVLSEAISEALLDEAKPLKYLRGDAGRIEVPVRIQGNLPEVSAKPDSGEIANRLGSGAADSLVDKGEKALEKTLDKKVGNKVDQAWGKLTKKNKKKKKKKSEVSDEEGSGPAEVDEDGQEALEPMDE